MIKFLLKDRPVSTWVILIAIHSSADEFMIGLNYLIQDVKFIFNLLF